MSEHKRNTLSEVFRFKRFALFALAMLVTAILWNLPSTAFGIEGLTVIQQRVIAIFAFATIMWVTEAISSWATSVTLIGALLFTTSDNAFLFFRTGIDKSELLHHSALMATFADPIIILFLGGFMLAIAATKSGWDVFLARALHACVQGITTRRQGARGSNVGHSCSCEYRWYGYAYRYTSQCHCPEIP